MFVFRCPPGVSWADRSSALSFMGQIHGEAVLPTQIHIYGPFPNIPSSFQFFLFFLLSLFLFSSFCCLLLLMFFILFSLSPFPQSNPSCALFEHVDTLTFTSTHHIHLEMYTFFPDLLKHLSLFLFCPPQTCPPHHFNQSFFFFRPSFSPYHTVLF